VKPAGLFHISQTVLAFDGTRQLRLFDSGADPPIEVVSERSGEETENGTGITLGAIPKASSLFDVAPMAF